MSGRDLQPSSIWVAVVGWASVCSLLVAAASGLWLEFASTPDAALAWDDIEELRAQVERGYFMADVRHVWSAIALGSTMVWFAVRSVARRRPALVVGCVFGLCLAARLTTSGSASTERTLLECGAACAGVVAMLAWHVVPGVTGRAGQIATGGGQTSLG